MSAYTEYLEEQFEIILENELNEDDANDSFNPDDWDTFDFDDKDED